MSTPCYYNRGTIVPVDPCHPISRIQYVFEDAKISLAIVSADSKIPAAQGIPFIVATEGRCFV